MFERNGRTAHLMLVLALVAAGLPACATREGASASTSAQPQIAVPRLEFEQFTLPNGLEVILMENHRLPLVAVNLWYHVGPANERPGRTGFAHLFEHMMFQGSRHVPDDAHFRMLEAAGATNINGTTNFDRTNYFETLPSNRLELALWLESDRMGFLLETLGREKLVNQRDVVRNERRQSIENVPYGLVEEEVFRLLFPKGHPYHASVIGSHADIQAAGLQDVRDFFRQYYAPNNASLAIVGDIDPARVRKLVAKYFGAIPAGPPVPKIEVATPPIESERRAVVPDGVELPRVYMAWLTPAIFTPGDAESDLLAEILAGGKSSRLYERLVYEEQIAQDVRVRQQSLALGSVFSIEATARPGVDPALIERTLDEEMQRLRDEGPTNEELERARNSIIATIVQSLERLGGFGGVADRLNRYNHFLGDPGYLEEDLARYREATLASLRRTARVHLAPDARVVVHGVPGEKRIDDPLLTSAADAEDSLAQPLSSKVQTPDSAWRNQPPQPGPAPELELPVPQRFMLRNGLTVLLLERHALPMVSASIVVLRGGGVNPPTMPGLAAFTADMLDEGTARRSALELAADLARIGATLHTSSNSDYSQITTAALTPYADRAFEILADVILRPLFSAVEVARVRERRITSLVQLRDDPNALATKVFAQALYGPRHPYGHIELGTEQSLRRITPFELEAFWEQGYRPNNAALVVAGNIAASRLRELAERYFGGWAGFASASTHPLLETAENQRRVVIVDRPGAPLTSLRVGQIGVPRSSPDYIPLQVMNAGFGGLFASRLNLSLREEHGYTYGARSLFDFRRGPGPFVIATSVRTDATAESVTAIFDEIRRLRRAGLSAAELQRAQDAVTFSLPALFETSPAAAAAIGRLFVYGLPFDHFNDLPTKIRAVDAREIERVARWHLDPLRMLIVGVGDGETIAPELRKLQLGPLEVIEPDGT